MITDVRNKLVDLIREYLRLDINKGIESLIIGLSGGLDSAVVSALISEVLQRTF